MSPRYSPDGAWILFVRVSDAGGELLAIPADGGEPVSVLPGTMVLDFDVRARSVSAFDMCQTWGTTLPGICVGAEIGQPPEDGTLRAGGGSVQGLVAGEGASECRATPRLRPQVPDLRGFQQQREGRHPPADAQDTWARACLRMSARLVAN